MISVNNTHQNFGEIPIISDIFSALFSKPAAPAPAPPPPPPQPTVSPLMIGAVAVGGIAVVGLLAVVLLRR